MSITVRLLQDELVQRREEGCDVGAIADQIATLDPADATARASIYAALQALEPDPTVSYEEPSDLAAIRLARSAVPAPFAPAFAEHVLRDRLYGAWLGRAAGCLLGKPCEGWSHDRIQAYLTCAGLYPLDDYFPLILPTPAEGSGLSQRPTSWFRGQIDSAPRDDDTDYTILGLHILEGHGPAFTSKDVATEWLDHLPYTQVYTAERVAYANLVNGLEPPKTATRLNPYREWIGAQIRADVWGYVNPGRSADAAEMAYRDAVVSHVKNGIYGEMWIAACLAAAFVQADPEAVIEAGLAEIPGRSRLAEAIRDTIGWAAKASDWQETWARINEVYGHYHGVHTINNACAVALALLNGARDFERSITIAVMCGWDTDCNGATAGSIVGAMLGAEALPGKWVYPLNDTIASAVQGFTLCSIADLAERTLTQTRAILGG